MSPFAVIDDGLRRWASKNNVEVATVFKDYEVRSFLLTTCSGAVQVWVEPQINGRFDVVGCNNGPGVAKRIDRVPVASPDIGAALDDLTALITRWKPW